jgi:spore coat protein A, manganese oxidase
MLSRRQLMRAGVVSGAVVALGPGVARAAVPLRAEQVAKFVTPLPSLGVMPQAGMDRYELAIRSFSQQILPEGSPATRVIGYGAVGDPRSFRAPGLSLEARVGRPVRVSWRNDLARTPVTTHLHGGLVPEESGGHPDGWYLPAGEATGSLYQEFRARAQERFGVLAKPGAAVHQYDNEQRAGTLWLRGLGNEYAGLYVLRGDDREGGYPEVPLVIQQYAFNADGSLADREADTVVVNGRSWPVLEVEPRRYRFRVLNAADTRELLLTVSTGLPLDVIGADGGLLPRTARVGALPVAAGERYDVVVDFTGIRPGTELHLINANGDPANTGQVLKFTVVPLSTVDRTPNADELDLPATQRLGQAERTRELSVNEDGLLGTVGADRRARPARWTDPVSENPTRGTTEIWDLDNRTGAAHSIHVHQVQFELMGRRTPNGLRAPNAWERGRKDTVLAPAGQVTRVKARFDIPGRFAWHSHGTAMMRPYQVV